MMTLRRCSILFLLLAVAVGLVKFTVESPRTGLLIDVTFVTAVVCFLICVIGHLGRRLAELAHPRDGASRDRHHSSPPPSG